MWIILLLDQDKKRIYTFRKNFKLKIFLILIATIFLSSCGLSDWAYTKTPNDYEVWHLSSGDIKLIHDDGKIVIEKFVLAFCYNDKYIGVQQIPLKENDEHISSWEEIQKEYDLSNPDCYIIDSETDTVYGPYTQNEYIKQIEILNTGELCEWIKTQPPPKDAVW